MLRIWINGLSSHPQAKKIPLQLSRKWVFPRNRNSKKFNYVWKSGFLLIFFLSFRFAPKLFRLPSILTSDNAGTWLVTRKNKNDNNITEEKKTTTSAFKNDNDNSKWLAQPKVEVKVETDVVTLTGRLTKLRLNKWFLVWVIFLTKINSLFFQVLFEIFFCFIGLFSDFFFFFFFLIYF